jgi:subtilisin family serine protease
MATPHVTGVAALVWIRNPTFTYLQVRSRLLSTTRANANLSGRCVTGGVVNAYNAVR